MKITGKISEWNIIRGAFKVCTPAGDYEIIADHLGEPITDALIEAMRNRKNITVTDEAGQ